MTDRGEPRSDGRERTVVRDMSFLGAPWGANACMVDVKDDRVIRMRPLRYYDQYTKEEVKPWVMHARGKTFEPGEKTLPPPLSLARGPASGCLCRRPPYQSPG